MTIGNTLYHLSSMIVLETYVHRICLDNNREETNVIITSHDEIGQIGVARPVTMIDSFGRRPDMDRFIYQSYNFIDLGERPDFPSGRNSIIIFFEAWSGRLCRYL